MTTLPDHLVAIEEIASDANVPENYMKALADEGLIPHNRDHDTGEITFYVTDLSNFIELLIGAREECEMKDEEDLIDTHDMDVITSNYPHLEQGIHEFIETRGFTEFAVLSLVHERLSIQRQMIRDYYGF